MCKRAMREGSLAQRGLGVKAALPLALAAATTFSGCLSQSPYEGEPLDLIPGSEDACRTLTVPKGTVAFAGSIKDFDGTECGTNEKAVPNAYFDVSKLCWAADLNYVYLGAQVAGPSLQTSTDVPYYFNVAFAGGQGPNSITSANLAVAFNLVTERWIVRANTTPPTSSVKAALEDLLNPAVLVRVENDVIECSVSLAAIGNPQRMIYLQFYSQGASASVPEDAISCGSNSDVDVDGQLPK